MLVRWSFLLGMLWLGETSVVAQPEDVVILANGNSPISLELAAHYQQARGISSNSLCVLDLPVTELITRTDFNRRLRDPLLEWLRVTERIAQTPLPPAPNGAVRWRTEDCQVKYLVSMHGVPLRIADTRLTLGPAITGTFTKGGAVTDTAAVDSELAILLHPGYGLNQLIPNPLYGEMVWPAVGTEGQTILIAARLDGPDPARVHRMIDDGIAAERTGILGRAYVDTRGLAQGGYVVGDRWMQEAYHRLIREGYDCVLDRDSGVFAPDFPMEDAGIYLGWYTEHVAGPFLRPDFAFPQGAVAYHLHSGSASTLRSKEKKWAGPLLARGATATMGAVHEPYLAYTPQLDVFIHRLCNGLSFGESAYLAQRALSWQMTVVGDPLYRPFKHTLEEQIRFLEAEGDPRVVWGYGRQINRMVRQGRFNIALRYCREKIAQTGSPLLREKLGDLYAINDLVDDAVKEFEQVALQASSASTAMRAGAKAAFLLRAQRGGPVATELLATLRERWEGAVETGWLDRLETQTQ